MKSPCRIPLVLSTLLLAFPLTVAAADSGGLDALQGTWSLKRTNQEGRVSSQALEIEKNRLRFRMVNAEGELRFFAKGAVTVQKLGPFQVLKIADIHGGRSEDATEAADDDRTYVFVQDGDTLTLASNFDKERDNERPRVETYTRGRAAAKQPEAGTAKLTGTWKMAVRMSENETDYELRVTESDGKLSATLISPRSGEHKFRKIVWADDKLSMELDREYDGNPVTILYSGKPADGGLSGTFAVKGAEDQFSGTWKARK